MQTTEIGGTIGRPATVSWNVPLPSVSQSVKSNGHLNSSAEPSLGRACCGIHLVLVRSAEYEQIDVAHRSIGIFAGEPRRPRPVDVRSIDSAETFELLGEHPRHTERLDQPHPTALRSRGSSGFALNQPRRPTNRSETRPAAWACSTSR